MTLDYLRQLDILAPSVVRLFPVTIIGCGGIGSSTALALAKIGVEHITLIDGDTVEAHNIPNQLFRLADIGQPKVRACATMLREFSETTVSEIPSFFDSETPLSGIVASGVDSMKTRSEIWKKVRFNPEIPLYIDGRIGGDVIQIHTIEPCQIRDIETYEPWLFSDAEAAELPCTAQAIFYTSFTVAGLIASQLKKWLKKDPYYRLLTFDMKTVTTVLNE